MSRKRPAPDLPREAWAFHEIPEAFHYPALCWETEVEQGNGWPHWLALPEPYRLKIIAWFEGIPHGLSEMTPDECADRDLEIRNSIFEHHGIPERVHIFRVFWDVGPTAIKKAFADWVDSDPVGLNSSAEPATGGRRNHFTKLVDLAVLRWRNAGGTAAAGAVEMEDLLVGWARKDDSSYWANAKRRACERLAGVQSSAFLAKNMLTVTFTQLGEFGASLPCLEGF